MCTLSPCFNDGPAMCPALRSGFVKKHRRWRRSDPGQKADTAICLLRSFQELLHGASVSFSGKWKCHHHPEEVTKEFMVTPCEARVQGQAYGGSSTGAATVIL